MRAPLSSIIWRSRCSTSRRRHLAGLEAILKYAAQYTQDGFLWPDGAQIGDDGEEDGKSAFASHRRNWNFYLLRNLGSAVEKMVD
jgi:hypothetical protein